ncbi:MAG: type secretion system protein GspG [Akkermansiaceae bacterium]|nr:type secretion system protein GspG [Akkermansiaceae bacterium]
MKVRNTLRPRVSRGFTLLEMVIVLGIIALILGGAISMMGKIGEGAKVQRVRGDFSSIGSALKMYKVNNGVYPSQQQGLRALVEKPSSQPVPRGWTKLMDDMPKDPWGSDYGYKFPGRKDPTEFELISMGPDMQEGGDNDYSSQDPK